jgi:hypothetical protein
MRLPRSGKRTLPSGRRPGRAAGRPRPCDSCRRAAPFSTGAATRFSMSRRCAGWRCRRRSSGRRGTARAPWPGGGARAATADELGQRRPRIAGRPAAPLSPELHAADDPVADALVLDAVGKGLHELAIAAVAERARQRQQERQPARCAGSPSRRSERSCRRGRRRRPRRGRSIASSSASSAPIDRPATKRWSTSARSFSAACSTLRYQSRQPVASKSSAPPQWPASCTALTVKPELVQATRDEAHLDRRAGQAMDQQHARAAGAPQDIRATSSRRSSAGRPARAGRGAAAGRAGPGRGRSLRFVMCSEGAKVMTFL